ncbi:hypothetical protein ACFP3V_04020, partial [Streptacidiphilus monticola]
MKKLLILGACLVLGMMTLVLPLGLASGSAATTNTADPTTLQLAGIPPVLGAAYQRAVDQVPSLRPGCRGMRWQILAALAQVESTQAAGHHIAPDGQIT